MSVNNDIESCFKNSEVIVHYVQDFRIKHSTNPPSFIRISNNERNEKANTGIDINAVNIKNNLWNLEIYITIDTVNSETQEHYYTLNLAYFTMVIVNCDFNEDIIKDMLVSKISRLAFPFMRHLIFSLTKEAGMSPIAIGDINFEEIYNNKKQNKDLKTETDS